MGAFNSFSKLARQDIQWLQLFGEKAFGLALAVFLKIFPRPKLDDPDKNRSATVIADFFGLFFIYTLGGYLEGFSDWSELGHTNYVGYLVALLLIRYLACKGSVTLSVGLSAAMDGTLYLVSTLSYGFFEHMQALNLLMNVALATILVGPRFGLLTTTCYALMFWGLYWASQHAFLTPLETWLPDGQPRSGYTLETLILSLASMWIFAWLSRAHIFSQLFDSLEREKLVSKQEHEARKSADKANREKTRFLAAASHDLRQPVSALNLNFESYLLAHPEARREDAVGDMASAIETMNRMLDSVLTVSKLQARVVMPVVSSVSINSILQRCYAANSAAAKQKGLQLRLRSTDVYCETDPDMLYRAVNNLVDNAVKYTNAGGIIVGVRRRYGGHSIFVMDSGIGIPQDSFENIFEEFIMLNDASRKNAGSGLGLSIVKRTAHLLGIRVRTESVLGVGSTFYLQLPTILSKRPVESDQVPPAERFPVRGDRALHGLLVAVVDDVATVRTSICRLLQANGLRTIDAGSWAELVPQLHEVTPDLLITDYQLDLDASGYDVVLAARKHISSTLPCFIITGDTSPELVAELADLNVETCYKPLSGAALLSAIRRVLDASKV